MKNLGKIDKWILVLIFSLIPIGIIVWISGAVALSNGGVFVICKVTRTWNTANSKEIDVEFEFHGENYSENIGIGFKEGILKGNRYFLKIQKSNPLGYCKLFENEKIPPCIMEVPYDGWEKIPKCEENE